MTYRELTEDVHTYLEALTKEYEIQLELRFESGRGYFFRIPFAELEDRLLPEVFVNVVKRKKFVEFSTLELTMRNAKVWITGFAHLSGPSSQSFFFYWKHMNLPTVRLASH